jgi:hypothetical protein
LPAGFQDSSTSFIKSPTGYRMLPTGSSHTLTGTTNPPTCFTQLPSIAWMPPMNVRIPATGVAITQVSRLEFQFLSVSLVTLTGTAGLPHDVTHARPLEAIQQRTPHKSSALRRARRP